MNQTGEGTTAPQRATSRGTTASEWQGNLPAVASSPPELAHSLPASPPGTGRQSRPREPGVDDAQMITRILVGLLASGSGELIQRLRELEQDVEANRDYVEVGQGFSDDTTYDLLRYLALGLLMRGQRTAIRRVRSGFYLSLGTASWLFNKADSLTDNWLMRPVRRPIASRLRSLADTTSAIIDEGKHEEEIGRWLAKEAALTTMDDVVEVVAENPEVTQMIQQVVAGQGVGLATVMQDNARQIAKSSDDVVEGVLRRILRRAPRQALPPSPLAGQPQTMYTPEVPKGGTEHDQQ